MNTFFLIVLGQIISLFGNAALRFALPLYLLRQTGSAALYGGITALACLTQPIGQAAYGSAFQRWAAHPADVLLAAGVLSALVLWLLQTRRTA